MQTVSSSDDDEGPAAGSKSKKVKRLVLCICYKLVTYVTCDRAAPRKYLARRQQNRQ
jgi:hypothetical protein